MVLEQMALILLVHSFQCIITLRIGRTFEGFIRNLKENIKKGGYFIGTCYDGKKIFDYFKGLEDKKRKYEEEQEEEEEEQEQESEEESEEEFELDIKKFDMSLNYKDVKGNIVYKIEKKYETDNFDYSEEK